MKIENPYTKKLHTAIKNKDTKAADELWKKYIQHTKGIIDSISAEKHRKLAEIQEIKDNPSYHTQYTRAIKIYRELMVLVDSIRTIKKEMRENRKNYI